MVDVDRTNILEGFIVYRKLLFLFCVSQLSGGINTGQQRSKVIWLRPEPSWRDYWGMGMAIGDYFISGLKLLVRQEVSLSPFLMIFSFKVEYLSAFNLLSQDIGYRYNFGERQRRNFVLNQRSLKLLYLENLDSRINHNRYKHLNSLRNPNLR